MDQEIAANSQLRTQLEQEKQRNLELETLVSNERNTLTDMRKTLESDEEKIRDLVNALEIERAELKEVRLVVYELNVHGNEIHLFVNSTGLGQGYIWVSYNSEAKLL